MLKTVGVLALSAALAVVSGCASTSVMPLSADTYQIMAQGDPDCGISGAQRVAMHRAAVETITRGFDSFIIVSASAANNTRVIGHTPIQAQTNVDASGTEWGNSTFVSGRSTTTYTGGQAIMGGTMDQTLVVRMFRNGDPGSQGAISARNTLGPDWQREVAKGGDSSIC